MRLAAVRFEPQTREVTLVGYAPAQGRVYGFRGDVMGNSGWRASAGRPRQAYADMFGPTTATACRLSRHRAADRGRADYTVYGDEVKFGGGKVIRDGMGPVAAAVRRALDTVITNAVIVDHWGHRQGRHRPADGRIAAIGKAGNPDIQPGVTSSSAPAPR